MKRYLTFCWFIFLGFTISETALAGKETFEWLPVTEADWEVRADSAQGIHDAVILFEKIFCNDEKLFDDKCYYSIYQRIRILSPEGRKWGDVTAPYVHKKQKIEEIRARAVLPNGQEVLLPAEQILEKEIFKSGEIKIKQKSFSIPGMANDCIIEYFIKYRVPTTPGIWLIQKEIHLKKGEFTWKFYQGGDLTVWQQLFIMGDMKPNYLWLNTQKRLNVEQRPSLKNPEEVIFTIDDVPAFESEPYATPDIVLKAQLRDYYGSAETPAAYWGNLSSSLNDFLGGFTQKDKKVSEIVESFRTLNSREEKVRAAYEWLQKNLKNTTYAEDDEQDFKDNNSVDDVIKRGYGSAEEINIAFYDLLREMNIDAKIVYLIDWQENFLVYDAKYWQFDRSAVRVPDEKGYYDFYCPGEQYLACGDIPWVNEGTPGFLIGDMNWNFIDIPFSEARSNRTNRSLTLAMDDQMQLRGPMAEKLKGHAARTVRLRLHEATEVEKLNYLQERFSENFPSSKADSFRVEGLQEVDQPVNIHCNVKNDFPGIQAGDRLLLKPYNLFSAHENPFNSETRKYSIMFEYAREIIESLAIELPEQWKVEALPPDSSFANPVGLCQVVFRSYGEGKSLSVQRVFKLNGPSWKASDYPYVRALFQAQKAFEEMTVVLKKGEPG